MADPDTAATLPAAPGGLAGAVVVGPWLAAALVDAVLAPPQAAAASANTPRPATTGRVLAVTVAPDMDVLASGRSALAGGVVGRRHHSLRRASIGESRAALEAGGAPQAAPVPPA